LNLKSQILYHLEEFFENELAKKFEDMIENNEQFYFDTEEVEDIVIFYLEMGDINFAEMAVNYGLNLHPNSIELKVKQLEVFLELEKYVQARQLIEELKPSCSESTDFLVCCAKYYSNNGNPRKSIEFCEKALELEEEESFLHNFIADEYYNLQDPFNALKNYKLALKHDPQDEYALESAMMCYGEMTRHAEAEEFLQNYINQFPFSETAWFEMGQFYFNRKNYEKAIQSFDYLLAINSDAAGVYANKAACYEAMEQWEKAIEVYQEQLELEYTKAFTFYKIGLCYKAAKKNMEALRAFQKSLREDPQFYLSMMEQSDLYLEMGSMKEALHFAKEAVALNENNLEFQKKLAFLYIDSGRFEESLSCLKKLVDVEPKRFYNWYAYSEVIMLIGEYEDAITVLEQATKIHQRAELYYQLSNSYLHLNDEENGQKALQKALELDESLSSDMQEKYPFIKEQISKEKSKNK